MSFPARPEQHLSASWLLGVRSLDGKRSSSGKQPEKCRQLFKDFLIMRWQGWNPGAVFFHHKHMPTPRMHLHSLISKVSRLRDSWEFGGLVFTIQQQLKIRQTFPRLCWIIQENKTAKWAKMRELINFLLGKAIICPVWGPICAKIMFKCAAVPLNM